MVNFHYIRKEVNCKIVYYGPGLSGKTTNLEIVHQKTPGNHRGELTSIATEHDRTLFFDFMPIDLGTIGGMKTKLRLFTVPGQQYYNATRKLVLQGADGIIFVADSQENKMEANLESFRNLEENLKENKIDIQKIPLVIQWNKRDMPKALPIEELERALNYLRVPTFPAVAVTGEGVFPTLRKCAALVLESINNPNGAPAGATTAGPLKPVIKPVSPLKPKAPGDAPAPAAQPVAAPTGISAPTAVGVAGGAEAKKPIFPKFKKFGTKGDGG